MPDTDKELFQSAMSDEPEVQPVTIVEPEGEAAEPKDETAERQRDEKGRFAPKAEAEPKQPEQDPEPEAKEQVEPPVTQPPAKESDPDRIPQWRLKEEAEAKREALRRAEEAEANLRAMQQQLAQLRSQFQQSQQPQAPKPNLFENPEAWEQQQAQSVQTLLQQQQLTFSEQFARLKYGDEAYDAADKAAQQAMVSGQFDPMLAAVGKSPNPGMALVEWHKRKQALERLGNLDPDKYVEQEIEKRMNDPAFLAKAVERARAQTQAGPATQKPATIPSLNRQTSAAPSNPDSGDESDAAIFRSALTR